MIDKLKIVNELNNYWSGEDYKYFYNPTTDEVLVNDKMSELHVTNLISEIEWVIETLDVNFTDNSDFRKWNYILTVLKIKN